MPRTGDPTPGPSRRQCPQCAFDLPPGPMSDFDDAGHRVHHRRAMWIAARLRNVPIVRTELEAHIGELNTYVDQLEARAKRYRRQIAELHDDLVSSQWDLKVCGELVDDLKADLDAAVARHPAAGG